jgi:hypothetical protein
MIYAQYLITIICAICFLFFTAKSDVYYSVIFVLLTAGNILMILDQRK